MDRKQLIMRSPKKIDWGHVLWTYFVIGSSLSLLLFLMNLIMFIMIGLGYGE